MAYWEGEQPYLGDLLTMAINHVSKSWDDPPSSLDSIYFPDLRSFVVADRRGGLETKGLMWSDMDALNGKVSLDPWSFPYHPCKYGIFTYMNG